MMLTGDHPATAKNIARATGLKGWETAMTGQEVMELDEPSLMDAVKHINVFARMFPEAKLRVIETLKAGGDTVAMSGDGVNDGPALKSAQIGVAMGLTGTEIAKTAASLVLLTDDLKGMTTAISMGRRIYNNLRKAIRYIISIHLPIVVLVIVPLLLEWPYPHILLPLHVIFLELVMDPIAAIAFENKPLESNAMRKPPRNPNASLFSWGELGFSLLVGIVISFGALVMYQYAIQLDLPEETVRSFVFVTLVSANLFLTLAYRSFDYTFIHTLRYKNRSMPLILGISILMLLLVTYLPPVAGLFRMSALSAYHFMLCCVTGLFSVLWFEVWKAVKRGVRYELFACFLAAVLYTLGNMLGQKLAVLRENPEQWTQQLETVIRDAEARSGIQLKTVENIKGLVVFGAGVSFRQTRDGGSRVWRSISFSLCS
jgi:P-type Ca2+ transporter type 2C